MTSYLTNSQAGFARAAAQLASLEAALAGGQLRPDEAAAVLRARCLRFAQQPPPPDWDGVDKVQTKAG